ncbi:MAG: PQQ-binding-like beta-propeller repeat protein [Pirellulales bacterium]|nr:PQQ-binding-like beta-propeller repeat protein [Pirellulales bacterium]
MNQDTPTDLLASSPGGTGAGHRIATRIAAVAGVFTLVVGALLLYDYSRREAEKLLEDAPYLALKAAAVQQPDNEQLKAEIRKADLHRRAEYFRQRRFTAVGAWLLIVGAGVFLVAQKSAATLRRRLPDPGPQTTPQDFETRWTRVGRWSVAALAVALLGAAVGLILSARPELPQSPQQLAELVEKPGSQDNSQQPVLPAIPQSDSPGTPQPILPTAPPPSAEEIRKMWPSFRGPGGTGISAYANVPTSWNGKSGDGIRWKEPVPLPGFNSPVVWADHVFLSGATEERREVYCFDAETGKLLWRKDVPGDPRPAADVREPEYAGYAAPTVATDGRYVFAIFAGGDLAAFTVAGERVWTKHLGAPANSYGHASSLVTYGNVVLVQLDQGTKKAQKSRLFAFDMATGEITWQAARDVSVSWASPILIHHAERDQLITCSDPWVIAYNPADGTELWRANVISGESGPSPVFADGIVCVGNEYCVLSAIRVDGEGDVTDTHVVWSSEEGLPDTCSPLVTGEFVFEMPSSPYFTCLDVKTGELLWDHEFEGTFTSSPGLVGNRIYLFGEVDSEDEVDEEGFPVETAKTWIVEPSREGCQIVGECELGEGCVTCPAFQDGRIYIRGKTHLFCIGQK